MSILNYFRKTRFARVLSVFTLLGILEQFVYPIQVMALTGGPSQPEVQSFEPIATTQMVDPFSGDFTYNIPLFDVGGYPINISYHSGIAMDQEATSVGLGWNINPGVINRHLNGIPDDFKGDVIKYENNFKPQIGIAAAFEYDDKDKKTPPSGEIVGISTDGPWWEVLNDIEVEKINYTTRFGIQYHNYRGLGYDIGFGKGVSGENWPKGLGANFNLSFSSFEGYDATAGLSYQNAIFNRANEFGAYSGNLGAGLGIGLNSRAGIKEIGLNVFTSKTYDYTQAIEEAESKAIGFKNFHTLGEIVYVTRMGNEASSINGGMSLLSSAPSFAPTSEFSTKSASYAFSYKTGIEMAGLYGYGKISASVDWFGAEQQLTERKALGSIYLPEYSNMDGHDQYLLDYNQILNANGAGINKFTQNIHQVNQTADNFSISGQGTSGNFKAYLGSVGTLHQPKSENRSLPSGNLDLEVGVGNLAKLGINLKYIYRKGYSGKWRNDYGNIASNKYSFGAVNGKPNQEKTYFKNTGERISVDEAYLDVLNEFSPTSLRIVEGKCASCKSPGTAFAIRAYVDDNLSHDPLVHTGPIVKQERAERNQLWSHFTATEAVDFGLTKYTSNYAEPHHVAEVTVTGDDGRRYVYGQALYNTVQKEVSFNIANNVANAICRPGEFVYNTQSGGGLTPDNSIYNEMGKDHMFQSTELPPYAHSYYLTAVLSVDYMDVDNNGPTPNDLGDYVLFEYDKVMEDYKWRTPYNEVANGHVGLESNEFDDKASYVYGEKEVWYIKTIRSKSQRAEFIYDETGRKDSYEVVGENGGIGTRTLWKLDKIEIYAEHGSNTFHSTYNPAPTGVLLKTVHFAYSYDLCPNVPNNIGTNTGIDHPLIPGTDQNISKGKLTLHKIWFTYQNSELGAESPYIFTYSSQNPAYAPEAVDRWGNYKPNDCNGLYNSEFPYSQQNESFVHENASAWNLSEILLPSGGKISLEYESDDYQFVQDRDAMEMVGIIGFGKSATDYNTVKTTSNLYDGFVGGKERRANNFVFVSLPHAVSSNEEFREKYLKDMKELYFKVRVNLNSILHPYDKRYEFIEGFAEIEKQGNVLNAGVTSNPLVGWIELKTVGLKEGQAYKINPISKTAWQFIRTRMNYLVYPSSDFISDPDNIQVNNKLVTSLLAPVSELLTTIRGFNGKMLSERYAQETVLTKSVVRLHSSDGKKYGGGSRIKSISFSDEWAEFNSSNLSSTYTTQYDYVLEDGSSSGVASYEPIIGGEENPFKVPVHYTETTNLLALANHLYDLEPFCEFLYPAAMVGYSRVVTTSKLPQDTPGNEALGITKHTNGYSVSEFYTAKDFPTKSTSTGLSKILKGSITDPMGLQHKLASMFGSTTQGVTASQGFQIILNDMHGKPKSHATYNSETSTLVNKVSFEYKVQNEHRANVNSSSPTAGRMTLDNNVLVLKPDGSFENRLIGVDVEAFVDLNESREITHVPGIDMNFDFTQVSIPLLFKLPVPKYRRVENYNVTASMTKVITQSGLLVKTISTENNYSIETENVAFDSKTGAVLLTKTKNAFNDDIYNLTYPAHWAYEGMGQAYENIGFEFDFEIISGVGYTSEEEGQYLCKGDEIAIEGGFKRYWIFHIDKVTVGGIPKYRFGLIDAAGNIKYNDTYHGKVIRSGHRNMQGLPIGQVVSKNNPLNATGSVFGNENDFSKVLAASAIEYDENWQTFRGFHEIGYKCEGSVFDDNNPCSAGLSFKENRYALRMKAIGSLCLTQAAPFGNPASICEGTECPGMPFKRDMDEVNDPINKKIPDETDPAFDEDQTYPDDMGSFMTKHSFGEDFFNTLADLSQPKGKGGPFVPASSYFETLTASLDNAFVAPSVAFPSCNQMITHMEYVDNSTANVPNGVIKYKNGTTTFCAEMFTFQYVSDMAILKDVDQMASMTLIFRGNRVKGGVDYSYSKVVFPAYPDLVCYMWSTCPDCDVSSSSGSSGTPPATSGGTPIVVQPEVAPPGNSQGVLPGGENPYILGIYGNWRPKRSYIYYDTRNTFNARTQTEAVPGDLNSTNIREDGVLQGFKIFWNPPAVNEISWTKPTTLGNQSDPWKWNSESDQYHPNGYEIQTHDIIGIFNAAYFSPVNFQPYFVVNNASLKNSVGENFEDYWDFFFDADCNQSNELIALNKVNINDDLLDIMKTKSFHWNLWTSFNPFAYVSENYAHTGTKSLRLTNTQHPQSAGLDIGNQTPGQISIEVKLPSTLTRVDYQIFKPGNADLIDQFNPDQTEYFVSFWVKAGIAQSSLDLKVANALVTPVLPLMASPIEGWIKKTYKVTYQTSQAGVAQITLSTNGDVYVDDLRIHPVNAQMKTFTYDKKFLRLASTSDENNYATFYEYDLEGNLVRVKRETERGIFTISENRKNLKKSQP